MVKTIVYLKKSTNPSKKYMVYVDGKTIHFGADGMSDYTKHKDKDRMQNYISRHKRRENWTKSGIKSAGFWSRWLLWNKPSLTASKRHLSNKFNVTIKNGWPSASVKKTLKRSKKKNR